MLLSSSSVLSCSFSSDLHSTTLPLFTLCPNARAEAGENRDKWVPASLPSDPSLRTTYLHAYEFIGQMMGVALRSQNYIPFNLPSIVWKSLVGTEVTQEDVRLIDLLSFNILTEIRNLSEQKDITPEGFDSSMSQPVQYSE